MGTQESRKTDTTIKNVGKALETLAKHADLNNPESVKTYIATADKQHGYKRNLTYAYDQYVKIHGLTWTRPVYYQSAKMPKIPHEEKINCIMANSSRKLAVAIAMSRDTGLRPIELMNLKRREIAHFATYILLGCCKQGVFERLTFVCPLLILNVSKRRVYNPSERRTHYPLCKHNRTRLGRNCLHDGFLMDFVSLKL